MKYIEFVRPNGVQHPKSIELDDRTEKLYQLCSKHPDSNGFTYEDCGTFINLCFNAYVRGDDVECPSCDPEDVVCKIVNHECMNDPQRRVDAWAMTVAEAADYLNIRVADMVGEKQ